MTVRRRTLVSLWADCDGTCGQWIAPADEGAVLTSEGDLADLLDMHGWTTITRWGQRFHYCPECTLGLCHGCARFTGADETCVFCAVRSGRPWTGAGVGVAMGAHPYRSSAEGVLVIPHARIVATSLEDPDTVALTVAASGGELALPATITAEFTVTDVDPDTVRTVFGGGDPRIPEMLQAPRRTGPRVLRGWALVAVVCVVVWAVFGLLWLLG